MGIFILTGSQQFGLMSGITQSFAGRTAFIKLLPFSISEFSNEGLLPADTNTMLFAGCYPPIYDRKI